MFSEKIQTQKNKHFMISRVESKLDSGSREWDGESGNREVYVEGYKVSFMEGKF